METTDTVIAVFSDHNTAEAALKKLTAGGFEMKNVSVVGKGFTAREKSSASTAPAIGSGFGAGEGRSGAVSGACSLAAVHGPFRSWAMSSCSDIWPPWQSPPSRALSWVGGLGALGAPLYSIGVPKDSVIRYEAAVKADGSLVMAHGTAAERARAKAIPGTANPSRLDLHQSMKTAEPAEARVPEG